jgi:uridine phosphorylase
MKSTRALTSPLSASDFPVDPAGRVYHLQLHSAELAPNIIIVGDPGRATEIGQRYLVEREFERSHRGLVTVTGRTSEGLRVTVTTSGMGTPSLEIVLQELVALNEIDFSTRTRKTDFERLHIIRVGTSGGLQGSTTLGTPIITTYGVGFDNTGLFYDSVAADPDCSRIEQELHELLSTAQDPGSRYRGAIYPYVGRCSPEIVEAMIAVAGKLHVPVLRGLTVSNSGFFANQGRDVARIPLAVPDIDRLVAEYDPKLTGERVENMEMETSFLAHFMTGLGYLAGSICPAISNRRLDTFAPTFGEAIHNAVHIALGALTRLRAPEIR